MSRKSFHPCRQSSLDPYPWLDDRYDLRKYTPAHLRAELEVANLVLHLLDGQQERTYAYTCCDTTIGNHKMEQPLEPVLTDLFVAARGALTDRNVQSASALDPFNLGCIRADGRSLEELIHLVERARANGGWAVLTIHGVGAGSHDLYLDADVHQRFIAWLAQQRTIWAAPLRTIARYLKQHLQNTTRSDA